MHPAIRCACWILVGTLLSLPALSATPIKLLAPDDMSCGAWKATKGDPERREPYLQWVRGFLSGHNYVSQSRQVGEVSAAAVTLYVDRYCAEHAAANIATAAMRMSDEYSGRNGPITR